MAQYLLTKEYGNRETMLAFAEALGKEVEQLGGKTRIEISKQGKDTSPEQAQENSAKESIKKNDRHV
jgi:hypothetical protein